MFWKFVETKKKKKRKEKRKENFLSRNVKIVTRKCQHRFLQSLRQEWSLKRFWKLQQLWYFFHFTDRILYFVFWHSWHGGGHDSDKIRQTTWEFPLSLHLSIARLHHYDSLDWATRLVQKVKIFFCVCSCPLSEKESAKAKKPCWVELNYSQFLNFSFFLQKTKVYINIIFEIYIFQQMISILYFFPKCMENDIV